MIIAKNNSLSFLGLERIREVPAENLGLIASLFQYQSCRVTFTPNIKAVNKTETQLLEKGIPKWTVSLDLAHLNLETFVLDNNLHKAKRCPVADTVETIVDDQSEGGGGEGRGGQKEPSVGAGGDAVSPVQLDPESQHRIQDWIQQSSNQYEQRPAGDGQSRISSAKGKTASAQVFLCILLDE